MYAIIIFGKLREERLAQHNKIEPQGMFLSFISRRPEGCSARQNRPSPSLAHLDTKTETRMTFVRGEADSCDVFASMVNDHMLINVTYCLGFLTHYY